MKSHLCEFEPRDLARLLSGPLVVLMLFAILPQHRAAAAAFVIAWLLLL